MATPALDGRRKSGTYRLFVTRKPVERLSKSELDDIVDDGAPNRDAIGSRTHGGDPKKAFASVPRVGEARTSPRFARCGCGHAAASLMAPVSTGLCRSRVEPSHRDLPTARMARPDLEVVSLFERSRDYRDTSRSCRRGSGRRRDFVDVAVARRHVHFPEGKTAPPSWRVQKIGQSGQIVLDGSTDARQASRRPSRAEVGELVSRRSVKQSPSIQSAASHPAND